VSPVGVEYAGDLDAEPRLAMVVEKQRLCATFALVVTRSRSAGIDAAPIGLRLGGGSPDHHKPHWGMPGRTWP